VTRYENSRTHVCLFIKSQTDRTQTDSIDEASTQYSIDDPTPSPSLANSHLPNQQEINEGEGNDTDSQIIEESEERRGVESPIIQKGKILK